MCHNISSNHIMYLSYIYNYIYNKHNVSTVVEKYSKSTQYVTDDVIIWLYKVFMDFFSHLHEVWRKKKHLTLTELSEKQRKKEFFFDISMFQTDEQQVALQRTRWCIDVMVSMERDYGHVVPNRLLYKRTVTWFNALSSLVHTWQQLCHNSGSASFWGYNWRPIVSSVIVSNRVLHFLGGSVRADVSQDSLHDGDKLPGSVGHCSCVARRQWLEQNTADVFPSLLERRVHFMSLCSIVLWFD